MDNRLRQLFRSIFIKHRSVMQEHLAQYDLYVGQPRYLKLIRDNPGITQQELVAHLKVAKETVSVTLKRLESANYIHRVINEQDRRVKNLYLTDRGNDTVEKLNEYFATIENAMFESLSDDEKIQLERFFKIMLEELEKGDRHEEIY